MKLTTIALAGAAALALTAGSAHAQRWMPIVERQAMFDDRIAAALEAGDMSRAQATELRADLDALISLEGRYRYGGLSARERVDLDRRYGDLDAQIRIARADGPAYPDRWASIESRKLELDRRIDRGLANGDLTASEAADLRDDFDAIATAEARYRLDGLSPSERADLDRQFDQLAARIHWERTDRQYGYNRY
jgi:hypothetical protein